MDHFQGITAQIISNGQVLDFYDDPDVAEIEKSRSRYLYVKAVAGSTFEVKVNLTPDFKFYKMHAENAVSIVVDVDGRDGSSVADSSTKKDLQRLFSQKRSKEVIFMGPTHFCEETGQWLWSDYSFGNLVLKEYSDPDFSAKQVQDLGALQMMGCIPQSPSPEAQSPDDETTTPGDMIQEVRDLRARLALLERGLNVKSESSRATTGLKREREDDEANEGSRQRRRTSVKAEVIDLTDD